MVKMILNAELKELSNVWVHFHVMVSITYVYGYAMCYLLRGITEHC